jgi:hypothetical protein
MFQPYMGRNMQETIIIYDYILNKVLCLYVVWLFSTKTRKLWDIKNRHLCFRLVPVFVPVKNMKHTVWRYDSTLL